MKYTLLKTMLVGAGLLACAYTVQGQGVPPSLFAEQGDPALSTKMSAFADRLLVRPTTKRLRTAVINRNALEGDALTVSPFSDTALVADKTDIGFTGSRYETWLGNLRDGKGSVVLIINGDRISGKINSSEGSFELYPMEDGSVAIVELEQEAFPECGTDKSPLPHSVPAGPVDNGDTLPVVPAQADGEAGDTPTANRVRVLVAYTTGSQTQTQSVFNRSMQEHIDLAVVESNQGYANSGVTMRMQLAHLYETGANETTAIENDVANFRGNGDGFADEVHAKRADYDADMCCLITDGTDSAWCGWAYGFDYTDPANMFQATAFSCATGNFTFAHEFGHTQGCRHNDDSTLTPFAYGHGFRNGSNWRTIMGLANSTGATRLNYWSNPDINSPVSPFTAMGTPINGSNFANDCETALDVGDATVVNHEGTPTSSIALNGNVVGNDEVADKIVTTSLTVGSFDAQSGSRVRFVSGDKITLQPGFRARTGSECEFKLGSPLSP